MASQITDLEGNLELWHRSIDLSEVLRWGADSSLELCDDAAFMLGGDAVDHGPGDLQILKDLVGLKKRYPDRVHLLVGNRDVNKIRLMVALADEHCAAVPLSQHPGVYWNTPAKPAILLEIAVNSTDIAFGKNPRILGRCKRKNAPGTQINEEWEDHWAAPPRSLSSKLARKRKSLWPAWSRAPSSSSTSSRTGLTRSVYRRFHWQRSTKACC